MFHKGGAEKFEGQSGATAFGNIGAFPQNLARIDLGAGKAWHIGRREDPGQSGCREQVATAPALHGHDFEMGADTHFSVAEPGQLAHGQAVAHGNGRAAHERCAIRLQKIAFDKDPANGVGPVEDDNLGAGFGGAFQTCTTVQINV